MRVCFAFPDPKRRLGFLQEFLPSGFAVTTVDPDDAEALKTAYREAEVIVGYRMPAGLLPELIDLQAFVVPWSGVPRSLQQAFTASDIPLYNTHYNATVVAEHALALLLAAAKNLMPAHGKLRRGDWTPRYDPLPSVTLYGRSALIVGFGAIGRALVPMLQGLGLVVAATRLTPTGDDPIPTHPVTEVVDHLGKADFVILTLPLTSATEGWFDTTKLAACKPGAILVNVSRGVIVDEQALYESLRRGHLGGAAIDTWYDYPRDEDDRASTQPSRFPFRELDNVVMSPHRASAMEDEDEEQMRALVELLVRIRDDGAEVDRVDPAKGY